MRLTLEPSSLDVLGEKFWDALSGGIPVAVEQVEAEPEIEAVGLIWSDGGITPLINQARSRSNFSISGEALAEAIVDQDPAVRTVAFFYHSHPGGNLELSGTDMTQMRYMWTMGLTVPWVIFTPGKKVAAIWTRGKAEGIWQKIGIRWE